MKTVVIYLLLVCLIAKSRTQAQHVDPREFFDTISCEFDDGKEFILTRRGEVMDDPARLEGFLAKSFASKTVTFKAKADMSMEHFFEVILLTMANNEMIFTATGENDISVKWQKCKPEGVKKLLKEMEAVFKTGDASMVNLISISGGKIAYPRKDIVFDINKDQQQEFLEKLTEQHLNSAKEDGEDKVSYLLTVSSETTLQEFINASNLIQSANCKNVMIIVAPLFDQRIEQDDQVKPPVAYQSLNPEDKKGRIIINILKDGTYTKADQKEILKDEKAITEYVKEQIKVITKEDPKAMPKLHLRGDKEGVFKFSQKAIKAASEAGISKVIFSVMPSKK